jgi:hypothetical protein
VGACSYRDLAGGALLMALIAGEAAELFEAEPVAATAARLMAVLRSIFAPQGIRVPDPVQVRLAVCALYLREERETANVLSGLLVEAK